MHKHCVPVLLAAFAAVSSAQNPPDVAIEMELAAPGVYVLYGRGGNIGVSVGDDGMFLVDDQYAQVTDQVMAALAKLHPEPPRFVVNTHWHGDHTGGNENLASRGSVVVAHDRVRERMSAEQFSELLQHRTPPSPPRALPVVTFSDQLTLHVNGEELRSSYQPNAHTDGDVIILFRKANVIHTGDLLFARMYPYIDLDSGGSVDGLIEAVDRMLALADERTRIIPGHGKLTDRRGLADYRKMLAVTSGRVRELVKAGRTLDEVLAAKPNADYDATLAWDFITAERFTRILYRDAERALKPGRT